MINYIRYTFKSIKNIIRWIPTLWNDRDWDGTYMHQIMKKKLEHMKEYFETTNIDFEGRLRVIEYISLCIKMLNKIIEDDFYNDSSSMIDKVEWFDVIGEIDSVMLKTRYKDPFDRDDMLEMMKIEAKYAEKYRKTLYNIIANRIQRWWI